MSHKLLHINYDSKSVRIYKWLNKREPGPNKTTMKIQYTALNRCSSRRCCWNVKLTSSDISRSSQVKSVLTLPKELLNLTPIIESKSLLNKSRSIISSKTFPTVRPIVWPTVVVLLVVVVVVVVVVVNFSINWSDWRSKLSSRTFAPYRWKAKPELAWDGIINAIPSFWVGPVK